MVFKPSMKPPASLHALLFSPLPSCIPVITSSSTREYTVMEPGRDGAAPSNVHTYQWRQTITFQECVHDDSGPALPRTQQLSVDSVFVLYNQEERILRYALSNSVGPVRGKRRQCRLGLTCAACKSLLCTYCFPSPTLNQKKEIMLKYFLKNLPPCLCPANLRPAHYSVGGGVRNAPL